jgi:hypothetical protein
MKMWKEIGHFVSDIYENVERNRPLCLRYLCKCGRKQATLSQISMQMWKETGHFVSDIYENA